MFRRLHASRALTLFDRPASFSPFTQGASRVSRSLVSNSARIFQNIPSSEQQSTHRLYAVSPFIFSVCLPTAAYFEYINMQIHKKKQEETREAILTGNVAGLNEILKNMSAKEQFEFIERLEASYLQKLFTSPQQFQDITLAIYEEASLIILTNKLGEKNLRDIFSNCDDIISFAESCRMSGDSKFSQVFFRTLGSDYLQSLHPDQEQWRRIRTYMSKEDQMQWLERDLSQPKNRKTM